MKVCKTRPRTREKPKGRWKRHKTEKKKGNEESTPQTVTLKWIEKAFRGTWKDGKMEKHMPPT